jgi:chromosome segregation ATPase
MTQGSYGLLAVKYGDAAKQHADPVAVAKQVADEHKPDLRLNVRMLPPLLQERGALENRIADRKHFISVIEPQIPKLRELVQSLTADLKAVRDAIADGASMGMGHLKTQEAAISRRLEHATWDLTSEEKRLNVAKTILKGTQKTLREFDKTNGELIKRLRALDAAMDGIRPSTYRGSGITQEVLLDVAQGRG